MHQGVVEPLEQDLFQDQRVGIEDDAGRLRHRRLDARLAQAGALGAQHLAEQVGQREAAPDRAILAGGHLLEIVHQARRRGQVALQQAAGQDHVAHERVQVGAPQAGRGRGGETLHPLFQRAGGQQAVADRGIEFMRDA
ncbi:hypothetical protein LP420_35645 [Massilia sp. B-10]|nr:hypothetical protein LP420_35645 [Massilia sp. B-10]